MARLALLLLCLACTQPSKTPEVRAPRDDGCSAAAQGHGDASVRLPAPVSLPSGCRFAEDEDPMLHSRRSVTVIASDAELWSRCRLEADAGAAASGLPFDAMKLLSVRVPHSIHLAWIAEQGGRTTLGEVKTPCDVGPAQPVRYHALVARTSTVVFELCVAAVSCGEE